MERIRKNLILAAIIFVVAIVINILIYFLFFSKKHVDQNNLSPINTPSQESQNPKNVQFEVEGYSPIKKEVSSFAQQFEIQFNLHPGNIFVEIDPQTPLIVTPFSLKIGGYVTISPKDFWQNNTRYTITIKAGSTAANGFVLKKDYVFSFFVKYYQGL